MDKRFVLLALVVIVVVLLMFFSSWTNAQVVRRTDGGIGLLSNASPLLIGLFIMIVLALLIVIIIN